MPNCPKCGGETGLWEMGLICTNCFMTMTYAQAEELPGFNGTEVFEHVLLYGQLKDSGLLRQGLNAISIEEDGLTIIRPDTLF